MFPYTWPRLTQAHPSYALEVVGLRVLSSTSGGNVLAYEGFGTGCRVLLPKVTGLAVPKTPEIALLKSRPLDCSRSLRTLTHVILLGAKIMISRSWKRPGVSFAAAKRKISWIMVQEKTVSILQSTAGKI